MFWYALAFLHARHDYSDVILPKISLAHMKIIVVLSGDREALIEAVDGILYRSGW